MPRLAQERRGDNKNIPAVPHALITDIVCRQQQITDKSFLLTKDDRRLLLATTDHRHVLLAQHNNTKTAPLDDNKSQTCPIPTTTGSRKPPSTALKMNNRCLPASSMLCAAVLLERLTFDSLLLNCHKRNPAGALFFH